MLLRSVALIVVLFPLALVAQMDLGVTGNKGLPIDIVSDELTVDSEKQMAKFKGNVEANQGTLNLKSDFMDVYYHDAESGGENALSRIVTKGHTHLTVPDKTAKSINGIYDVDKGIIVLQGKVRLTRGESVLKGDKFWYDVNSGRSRITSKDKPVEGGGKKQRVKGVFIPRKESANQEQKKHDAE